jgi:hypothetical protein
MIRRKKITMSELHKMIAQLALSGDTTDVMAVARDERYPVRMRFEACKAALPFHHVPLSPIEDEEED